MKNKPTINGIEAADFHTDYSLSDIMSMLLYGDEKDKEIANKWLEDHNQNHCPWGIEG